MQSTHLEHDLFLLLLNLSQVTGEERIKTLFVDSMNSFGKHLQLRFVEKQDEAIGEAIEIATLQNYFGFIDMQSNPDQIDESTKALVRNSVKMLSLFLEKQLHDRLLSNEKLLLNDLVEKQTRNLIIANKDMQKEIAERKRSEEALQESEEKFRSVFENAPLGILHLDKFGRITACNENLCKIAGSTINKIVGLDTKNGLKDEKMISVISKALAGNKSQYEGEYLSVTGGVRTPVRALFAPIISDNGKISGAIGILEDISKQLTTEKEKLKLMARLQQSQKMEAIGTLSGGIAHDFNNILFPIIGYAEMLQEDLPQNSPEQKKSIEILHAALRAKDLVKQILAFSRQGDQELKPVRLQSIIKETLKLLKSSIPATIRFQTDIDPDCGMVIANPSQIHQIIMNLATNAYHAVQESAGQIKIALKQTQIDSTHLGFSELLSGKYAILKVIDTGEGIKKEIMDLIFDPYFTTKETGKGTGLGLSVVQGIVKSCHGDIHVYSEPGKGTEFHVYLPIIKTITEINSTDPFEPIQGGSERILLVDDEEMIVKMEKQVLERLGYHVTTRIGSIEALEEFKADPSKFDLVISDMTMPGMTGVQLCNEIKKIRPDIPVIICTGFSGQINEETSKQLGIQGYVLKPVIVAEIAKTIREVLNIKIL